MVFIAFDSLRLDILDMTCISSEHRKCNQEITDIPQVKRKHISWKTKYACALLALEDIPYAHAREMTKEQIISLYHIDHGILHETENENVDKWWNLTPRLIQAHRQKTKLDAKIIAKGRRIRDAAGIGNHVARLRLAPLRTDPDEAGGRNYRYRSIRPLSGSHKLKSRGFDKRLRRKMDGTVVKRQGD